MIAVPFTPLRLSESFPFPLELAYSYRIPFPGLSYFYRIQMPRDHPLLFYMLVYNSSSCEYTKVLHTPYTMECELYEAPTRPFAESYSSTPILRRALSP